MADSSSTTCAGSSPAGTGSSLGKSMKAGGGGFGKKPATSGGKLSGKKSGLSETLSRLRAKGALK